VLSGETRHNRPPETSCPWRSDASGGCRNASWRATQLERVPDGTVRSTPRKLRDGSPSNAGPRLQRYIERVRSIDHSRVDSLFCLFTALICAIDPSYLNAQPSADALAESIQAQDLSSALELFAEQTGLQIFYVSADVTGKRSHAVPAGMRPVDGLRELLRGTAVQFELLNTRSVRVFASRAPGRERSMPAPAGQAPGASLEEVTVTATKRQERVGLVPMSLPVFTAEDLRDTPIDNIEEIAARTPGVDFGFNSQFGSGTLTTMVIRGIPSTVGIYLDDAPLNVRNTVFREPYPFTFDLERVEVLRGPQGTLFGMGTDAGAIRFIPRNPSVSGFSGFSTVGVSATKGGGPSYEGGAAANIPIVPDEVAARVSGWYQQEGGYVDRVDPINGSMVKASANSTSRGLARLALAIMPNESLLISPTIYYQSLQIHDSPNFFTYLSDPRAGVLRNGKLLQQPVDDHYLVAALRVESRAERYTLTSSTTYFRRSANAIVDETNGAGLAYFGGYGNPLGPAYPTSYANAVETSLHANQTVLTQEVRIASVTPSESLSWLLGVFYARANQHATRNTYLVTDPQNIGIFTDDYDIDWQASLFGDLTYAFATRWQTSVGTRVGVASVDATQLQGGFANGGTLPYFRLTTNENVPLTPRASVTYRFNEGSMAYVLAAKGLRPGGANPPRPPECAAPPSYGPDSLWSYEIGSKGTYFEDSLRLSAALFDIQWSGIHEQLTDLCGNGYASNAATAESMGADLSIDWTINRLWRTGVSMEVNDARYTKTVITGNTVVVTNGAAIGDLPDVPAPWSGNAWVEIHGPVAINAAGYVRAEWLLRSRNPGPFVAHDPAAASYDPGAQADPAVTVVNLYFGVARSFDTQLSITNVLNIQPTLHRDSDGVGSNLYYAHTIRPRTVSLLVRKQF